MPGVGGPLLFFALIRQRGATRASSLLFVVPAVTALAAWPILGTPIGPTTVLGLLVAGLGLWLARARAVRRPAPERQDREVPAALSRVWQGRWIHSSPAVTDLMRTR